MPVTGPAAIGFIQRGAGPRVVTVTCVRVATIHRWSGTSLSALVIGVYGPEMDTLTPEQRSERMSRVRGRDTKPELLVRRIAHEMGYRFRLHRRDLPGAPDLVFPSRSKVIFVHGCFWHRHMEPTCKLARMPKTRLDFWASQLENNRKRDAKNIVLLDERGWEILVIWECQTSDREALRVRVGEFLK